MKTSVPRIRSVRDKRTGREIRVLPTLGMVTRQQIEEALATVVDNLTQEQLGGYAIVVWSMNGSTSCDLFAGPVPRAMLPEMVRDRVLMQTARQWIAPLLEDVEPEIG